MLQVESADLSQRLIHGEVCTEVCKVAPDSYREAHSCSRMLECVKVVSERILRVHQRTLHSSCC